ncbi:hypothetical protein FIBSPDRAFT_1042217 [Athelia psychrophila]|uniref:NB-ARC domain-containing protein n=1 Tax=Athelia psychrophila TaxID=1759441 RepID=A0A166MY70_9AGAM|nr:hypothetical protein FIBSPDRAFT_1042217 [Fibularhizoctonia sp. CBS 109695]
MPSIRTDEIDVSVMLKRMRGTGLRLYYSQPALAQLASWISFLTKLISRLQRFFGLDTNAAIISLDTVMAMRLWTSFYLISSCFKGRHEDVQFIANTFAFPTGRAPARYAIWGMPGLGKSQLGLKYAHSSFESGRHTHIFVISATTVEKLTQGLAGVLELVQHPLRHNPDQSVQSTAALYCFEHSEKYSFVQWLIIFDNATSETMAFLRLHIPRQNSNGSILITTRTFEIAEALTNVAGQQHPICELKALSPADSLEKGGYS